MTYSNDLWCSLRLGGFSFDRSSQVRTLKPPIHIETSPQRLRFSAKVTDGLAFSCRTGGHSVSRCQPISSPNGATTLVPEHRLHRQSCDGAPLGLFFGHRFSSAPLEWSRLNVVLYSGRLIIASRSRLVTALERQSPERREACARCCACQVALHIYPQCLQEAPNDRLQSAEPHRLDSAHGNTGCTLGALQKRMQVATNASTFIPFPPIPGRVITTAELIGRL